MKHDTEWIEVVPGRWIEVTKALKRKVGVKQTVRVRATLDGKMLDRALRVKGHANRKYSLILLDEAVALAGLRGYAVASKKTGINEWSIKRHAQSLAGPTGYDGVRYTLARKRECVRLAQKLMMAGTKVVSSGKGNRVVPKYNHVTAFVEAGRRLGMNGASIMGMWNMGMISLKDLPPSSHPHAPSLPGGESAPPLPQPNGVRRRRRSPWRVPRSGSSSAAPHPRHTDGLDAGAGI